MITIRCSSLNLAARCPGYAKLAKEVVGLPRTSNKYADRGTLIHQVIANSFRDNPEPLKHEHPISDEMMEEINSVACEALTLYYSMGAEVELKPTQLRLVETPMAHMLTFAEGEIELTGTVDLHEVDYENMEAILTDWKTGYGPHLPPIEIDLQCIGYAFLMSVMYPEIKKIKIRRVLPDRGLVDHHEFCPADVEFLRDVLKIILKKQDKRYLGFQCDHCFIRSHCPEYLEINSLPSTLALTAKPKEGCLKLTSSEAKSWALCSKAVKEKVEWLDEELTEYIKRGGVIENEGKVLALVEKHRDKVIDHVKAGDLLGQVIGKGNALNAVKMSMSKTGISDIMKKCGCSPLVIRDFLATLKAVGVIVSEQIKPALSWVGKK